MAALPTDKIGMRRTGSYETDRVCGQCGAVVAFEHVNRHILWHAAAWASPVVTTDASGPV
jgi:hypothetical protein